MKVSVIVPNYNHAPYLKERLDSILAQTEQDIEVIILDDCSTDNSMEVLQPYEQHPKVRPVVRNATNTGSPFRQWLHGFELAQGEYIWIAESDDVAEPTFLEESLKRLEQHPQVQMTFTWSTFIDAEGKTMRKSPDRPSLYKGDGVYNGHNFALRRMLFRNVIYNASMVVFRKSALKNVSPDFQTFRSGGDWVFWFDIMTQGDIAEIPLRLNHFRQHAGKVTVRADKDGQNMLENARCLRHICSELQLTALQRKSVKGRMTLRFRKKSFPGKQQLKEQFPECYGGSFSDMLFYELDKRLGITGLLR
ncbi:MAG: glycosyltransferase [Prevotella sp.]|nr:glycosyltransferase [Prevotella sp.]